MSPEAYVIEVFSGDWIRNTVLTILFIVTYLFFGKFLSNKNKLIFAKAISVILIFITITGHTRNIINGYWNPVDNIPLHLCSISNFIACFILFVPKISKESKFFEFLYYAGIIGAFQAFFTPQINNFDGSNYEYIEWYLSHIGIMLLPIYMLKNLGFRVSDIPPASMPHPNLRKPVKNQCCALWSLLERPQSVLEPAETI